MTVLHIFVETNFLISAFRMPSKRHREALALQARFEAGEIKLYVPYLCLQEARKTISAGLPSHRWIELFEFHRYAEMSGIANWDIQEVKKFLDAANAEVSHTKAVHQRQLADFAVALGDGILHGTKEVFDFLEALDPDGDTLAYNDKLILSSVLVKAKELRDSGEQPLYFVSLDKKHLEPTPERPKMKRYYDTAGLTFVPRFVLPDTPADSM